MYSTIDRDHETKRWNALKVSWDGVTNPSATLSISFTRLSDK